jgi:hypothetical protein
MTTFLYYIYNRSRRHSVHIKDDCNPSILRLSVIFRSSSRDRTAHEKKENTAVWCVTILQSQLFTRKVSEKWHNFDISSTFTFFFYKLSSHVWHLLTFNEFPLHILMTFVVKHRIHSRFLDNFAFMREKKIFDLTYSTVAPLHASVHHPLPVPATVSSSSTISMLNKNNSADIHKIIIMYSFYHHFYRYPHSPVSLTILYRT